MNNQLLNPRSGLWAKSTLKKKFPEREEEIEDLFQKEELAIFQPAREKFQRRQTLSEKVNRDWQLDLMDISPFKEENDGYRFLLIRIDVLSRQADATPLKKKEAREVVEGLKRLFEEKKPSRISSDRGTEFKNQIVDDFLHGERVYQYFLNPPMKAALAERFIRTLWGLINRYQQVYRTYRFVDILPLLLENYNEKKHSTLGMAPNEVDETNEDEVYQRLSEKTRVGKRERRGKAKFKEEDLVRVQLKRSPFQKETRARWSNEIFRIVKRKNTFPWTYQIEDWNGEEVLGSFYEAELQKVKEEPEEFLVEEILGERWSDGSQRLPSRGRGRNRRKEVLVKWKGWDQKFNQWIPEEDVRDIVVS